MRTSRVVFHVHASASAWKGPNERAAKGSERASSDGEDGARASRRRRRRAHLRRRRRRVARALLPLRLLRRARGRGPRWWLAVGAVVDPLAAGGFTGAPLPENASHRPPAGVQKSKGVTEFPKQFLKLTRTSLDFSLIFTDFPNLP